MALFNLLAVDNFERVRAVAPRTIAPAAITTVRSLDEKEEIEPWIQAILYDTNRTPAQFAQPRIKADRALRRDASYVPQFTNVPIVQREYEVQLSAAERETLGSFGLQQFYGADSAAQLRDVLFSWWEKRYLG